MDTNLTLYYRGDVIGEIGDRIEAVMEKGQGEKIVIGQKPRLCSDCGQKVTHLGRHKKEAHGQCKAVFTCPYCKYSSNRTYDINRHKNTCRRYAIKHAQKKSRIREKKNLSTGADSSTDTFPPRRQGAGSIFSPLPLLLAPSSAPLSAALPLARRKGGLTNKRP